MNTQGHHRINRAVSKVGQVLLAVVTIFSMLATGVQPASAAPSTNALTLNVTTSQYVGFGTTGRDNLGSTTFTLELWFKRTGTGATTSTGTGGLTSAIPLLTKGRGEADGSNLDCNYFLGIRNTDNVLAADFEDMNNGLNHPIVGVTPIVNNVWYHAAATYNGTKWQLFLNGKLEAELTVNKSPRYDSIQYAALGTAMNSSGTAAGGFAGVLDEARVWNYARSQAEILSTMNVEIASPDNTKLLGYWRMNEGSGTTLTDSSGRTTPVNGTVTGATWTPNAGFPINADSTAPDAITGLAATAGDKQATLTWTASGATDLIGYNVYRSTGTPVPTVTPVNGSNLVTTNKYVDGGLTNGTPYYYVVTAVDSSGNASVAPTEVSATPASASGYALQFNGSTQYVTFGSASKLGVETFTIETWFKRAGAGVTVNTGTGGVTAEPLVTKGAADPNINYFLGIRPTDGFLVVDFDGVDPTGTNQFIAGTSSTADGAWHHGAVTYDGTTLRLYVDGVQQNSAAKTKVAPISISTSIAALATTLNSSGVASGYFNGSLDEVRIWNYARSVAEINTNKGVEILAAPGLLGRWGLNEGTGTQINDTSGRGINGTATNSPSWVTDTPFGVPLTPPAAPSGLTAASSAYFKVDLGWADNSNNETGFEIERSTTGSGGPFSLLTTASAGAVAYTDTAVQPVTNYCYRVRAVNGAGQSAYAGPACATTTAEGDAGLQFDGTNDYVTFGTAPGLGAQNFTVETWFKRTGTGVAVSTGSNGVTAVPLVTKGSPEADGSNVDENYVLGISGNVLAADFETYAVCGSRPAGDNNPIVGTTPINTDTWYHAAFTYDGTALKLYLNGNLEASLASTCLPRYDSIQHAALGTYLTSTGASSGYFQGVLDEVRIWNVAHTQAEIRSTINSELTSGIGLLARWGLNEGIGTTIYGPLGTFPGTLTNGPVWTSGSPFNIAFDTTPPAAPTNLMASARPGAVQLEWTANTETDLAGYRVYRGTSSPVVKGAPINGTLVPPSYTDSMVTAGITYYYAVTAVDTTGNESALSNEVSAVPLTPPPAEALDLGSAQAYVALGDNADTAQFTLETWLRRDGTGVATTTGTGGQTLIPLITNGTAEAETAAADINYFLGIRGSDGVLCADFEEAQTGTSPSLNHPVCGTNPLVTGTWYHAVATYNGTTWRLYLNGNLEAELVVGQPANAANTSQLAFGTSMTTADAPLGYFDGALDEVRIWNYARTQPQIASTINTKLVDPQTGLLGRWGLDEASGAVANDTSGNAINGTIMGTGYSWVAGSPFNATVNLPPEAPVLVAPLNNAANIPTTTTLSVNVTDPENTSMNVTFYGRPLQAAAGPDFTIAVIPDTQYYASTYPSIYNAQMQWVADNKTSNNIIYVASLGDNVDVASVTTQWTNANTAWNLLDAGGLAYGLAAGNHDGAPSGTATFNTNFGVSRFTGKSWYGGHYGSDNDNHYALFSASGMNFIVVYIEYDDAMTTTDHPVLQWANGLLQTYSSRRAIVVSHNLLQGGTSTAYSAQGLTIYNALKANPNLFLMLGGHLDVAARRTDTLNGNSVYTLRSDYQSVDSQQSGYLRLMRFSPTDDMIYVRTYSPTQNKDYDKSDATQSNFVLPYAMDGTGFSVIGTANGVASGGTASITWSGLNFAEQYEWFVIASDGTHQTSSETWNFTTASAGNNPPVITEGGSTSVTMSEDGSPTAFDLTLHATDTDGDTLTWSISTPASNGAASASGTGTSKAITYTPTANYNGADSFVVQVSDGNGGTDTITVNVTIQPVNDAPVCVDVTLTTPEDTAGEVSPACTDVDTGDTLTYSIVGQPANGAASVLAGKLNYVPAANYNGSEPFTYRAYDGTAYSNTATVNVTVTPVNDAPVVTNPDAQTNAEGNAVSLQIAATDVDIPAQTLAYSATGLPEGLGINPVTGLISGTITYHAAAHSPYSATVTVTDGTAPTSQNFTWNVTQAASGLCDSDPNLVACWPMEEGSSMVVIDATAFGNDGAITGSPTWVAGKNGQALNLNGTTQYAIVPDSNSLDAINAITLTAWVKPGKLNTQNIIKKTTGTTNPGYELSLSSAGKVFVRFNGSATYRIDSVTLYPTNGTTWMHIAATYDGTTIRLYINGVLEGSKPGVAIGVNTTNLGIGAEPAGTPLNFFQGLIDDARVYNRALTLAEIESLAGLTPPACYALTLNHTGQGSDPLASPANSTGCAAGQYVAGASINLSGALPTSGWQISSWTGTTNDTSTASTNTVTMPASAHTATVNYTVIPPACYALTLSHTGQGSDPVASPANSDGCAAGQYNAGASIGLSDAVPASGWQIGSWTGTINDASTASTNNVTMPASAHAAGVNYAQSQYTISGNADVAGATITYTGGSTTANSSGDYSFSILSGWTGTVTPSLAGYTFTPASKTYTNIMTDQTGQDYVATPVATPPTGLTCTILNSKPSVAEFDGSGHKPQSRVWQYDNTWWAVFSTTSSGASSAGTWLWKLEGTTWIEVQKLSTSGSVKADVKALGDKAYILLFDGSGPTSAKLATVQFSGGTYQAPVVTDVFSSLAGTGEVATLDIDSTGKMWVSMSNAANGVKVFYSDFPYSTWSGPVILASANVWDDDTTVVVALPGINKVGVLWGDQYNRVFRFFVHNDGADPATWTAETPPYNPAWQNLGSGSPTYGVADDHINLAVASDGTLYAAVKTSYDTAGYPKMALEIRQPNGTWDNLYSVDETGTRPIVLLDEGHDILTYIYTSSEGANPIVYRQSTTQNISFDGRKTLRAGAFNDVSSMKANYNNEFVVIYASSSEVAGQKCVTTLVSGADLSITKTDGLDTVRPNDTLTYTIVARNNGPEAVTGATVADTFPSALTNVSWACSASGGASCAASGTGNINDSVNLPVNASVTYTVSATLDLGARGSLANTATVTPPVGITDAITSNNTATDTDTIIADGTSCGADPTLVGCWQMEEGSGLALVDGSSYANDANVVGAPAWAAGKVGTYSLDLNGTSQYAVVTDDASLDLTNQITIATWIKSEAFTDNPQDLIKKATNGVTDGYELSLSSTGSTWPQKVFFRINQVASGDTYRINSTTLYPIDGNTWMHVAATYDGATMRLYINGVQEASLATTVPITTNNLPLTIGAQDGSTASRWFMGWMDDARVYNRALSLADIQALAGVTPPACYALTLGHTGQGADPVANPANSTGCVAGQYVEGESINLSGAAPSAGWQISGWTGTSNDSSTANTNTVMMPASDHSAVVNYSQIEYTLTYTVGANGSIVGTTPQTVKHGANGSQVTAMPDTGYHFVSWSDGVLTAARTDENVTANVSVTASFAINTFTLNYAAGTGGSLTGDTVQVVNYSADGIAVTAVPAIGYHFVDWSDGSTANPRTDTNVKANVNVTANFAVDTFTLTYTAGANGTLTGDTPQTVEYGKDGTAVTAVPAIGYHFVNWSDASIDNPRTDTNVTANVTVTANFTQNTYTISGTAGVGDAAIAYTGGSTTADGSGHYSLTVPYDWAGAVTPSKTGYAFTPPNRTYANVTADMTGEDYAAEKLNSAPVCANVTLTIDEDTTGEAAPDCADADNDALTYSIASQPANGAATLVGGNLVYTPNANYNGADSFTYKANDGKADSAPAEVTVTIQPVNDAPLADTQNVSTDEDKAVAITLTGSDVEGSALSYILLTGPSHGALTGTPPTVTYTPVSSYSGPDSFTFKVNDGELDSPPATVFITVLSVSVPPLPSSFYGEIHISDNPPAPGNLVEAYVTGVTGAAASVPIVNDSGTLVYAISVPGYDGSGAKQGGLEGDLITFNINGRVVATATWHGGTDVQLNLHPPKALPGSSYSGAAGTPINFSGSADDWGSDAATYQWDWDNDGDYEGAGQTPSYTWPDIGVYPVGLKVTDSQGGEGTATVEVTVNKIAAIVTLDNLNQTYNGTPREVTVITVPPGLSVSVTYDGLAIAPTGAGTYSVVATIINPNYTGFATGTLDIGQAASVVTVTCPTSLGYTGSAITPCSAEATGTGMSPVDVSASLTYTDNINIGTATANANWGGDANHLGGTGSKTFAIGKAVSVVTVTCPASQVYTGSTITPCSAEATGAGMSPVDVSASLTYTDNLNFGIATANASWGGDANHLGGTGSKTFAIGKAASVVTVTCPATPQTYTGSVITPCSAEATGVGMSPVDVSASLIYTDNINVGTATANVSWAGDGNHTANTGSGSFDITPASATVTLSDMTQVYDGTAKSVTVTTTPPGLSVSVTYNGSAILPINPGNYAVVATITAPNYTGAASGTFVILAKHSISLVPGWNLVSFNVHPTNTAIAAVLSSIDGHYNLVYAWDATITSANWKKYAPPPAPSFSNSLHYLDETMGFWIYMTEADTLDVVGSTPTTTNIVLSVNAGGWNLVGYPSSVNRDLPSALSDHGVGTDFSLVYAYHAYDVADPWKLYDIYATYSNDLKQLTSGWGYWIKVNADHTWSVE